MLGRQMLISMEGHSVADFDTQSAFNRWWTTTSKASWIQSTLYDYPLDGPAIYKAIWEPNLEIDN
jgi:hypothetical protein